TLFRSHPQPTHISKIFTIDGRSTKQFMIVIAGCRTLDHSIRREYDIYGGRSLDRDDLCKIGHIPSHILCVPYYGVLFYEIILTVSLYQIPIRNLDYPKTAFTFFGDRNKICIRIFQHRSEEHTSEL